MDAAPLFDQLRVEVVDPEGVLACTGCRQDFVVARDQHARGETTFAVLAPARRSDLRVRLRLFRSVRLRSEDPPVDGTIDGLFTLPVIAEEGVVRGSVFLPLESVGQAIDLAVEPPSIELGAIAPHAMHEGVVPKACTIPLGADEVCVPSGAYWMSSANEARTLAPEDPPERIVAIAPFIVDRAEVTVAGMRASMLAVVGDPVRTSGTSTECTYTDAPSANDALPVTCVSWSMADRFCKALGKRLLTEAEFEFMSSNRRSLRYVWGSDPPGCRDVVHARSSDDEGVPGVDDACIELGIGPAPAGTGLRDVLDLPSGSVTDLAGNVAEWTQDRAVPLSDACWGAGFFVDPLCKATEADSHITRGTSWSTTSLPARATYRVGKPFGDASTGFRCARNGI